MTRDEIILMADASGISYYGMGKDRDKFLHYLEAFANLVAAREREACAKVAAQPEPPPEWEAINNIIAEYGLQAIDFVSDWKAAQRPWQGLTDDDWEEIDNKKDTALDSFAQGAVWAADQLKERNT